MCVSSAFEESAIVSTLSLFDLINMWLCDTGLCLYAATLAVTVDELVCANNMLVYIGRWIGLEFVDDCWFCNSVGMCADNASGDAVNVHILLTAMYYVALVADGISHAFVNILTSNITVVILLISALVSVYCFKRSMYRSNKISYMLFIKCASFVYAGILLQYLGTEGKKYFSYFLFLFYFIIVGNIVGLFPSLFAITSNLTVTLFLSSVTWVGIFLVGVSLHGWRFFYCFYPSKVPIILAPFLMSVELISYLVRVASLSLRLFANIVAGHILLDTISLFFYNMVSTVTVGFSYSTIVCGVVILLLLCVLLVFELIIAILQAYIFVVLSIIYLRDSIELHA